MITDGRFMQVDNRFVQTARRWLSSDFPIREGESVQIYCRQLIWNPI